MIGLTKAGRRMLTFIVMMERQGVKWSYEDARVHLGVASKSIPHTLGIQLVERGYARYEGNRLIATSPGDASVPELAPRFQFIPLRAIRGFNLQMLRRDVA